MNEQMLERTRKLLSDVRCRTLPEIRRDLPDGPWRDLPLAVAEEWGNTRKALNVLVARKEVQVRVRTLHETRSNEGDRRHERVGRQEYKLVRQGGKRFRLPKFFTSLRTLLNPLTSVLSRGERRTTLPLSPRERVG